MKKEQVINHGQFRDDINYKALIEAQANTLSFLENESTYKNSVSKSEKSKVRKLMKSKIRGRLNK